MKTYDQLSKKKLIEFIRQTIDIEKDVLGCVRRLRAELQKSGADAPKEKTMIEPEADRGVAVPCSSLLGDRPFFARYRHRDPDPGVCRIVAIDWENKHLSMSNGRFRYSPSFDEVEIVPANVSGEMPLEAKKDL